MVKRVDCQAYAAGVVFGTIGRKDTAEQRLRHDGHGMGGLGAVGVLRMLDGGADMLCDAPFERGGKCLYAAAYTEDGHLPVEGQASDEQLGQVALGVDASQLGHGLVALEEWVDVSS